MKKQQYCQPTPNHSKGFTLVEVLVSLVILAVGILGTIAMQARSLNDNQDAYLRTQAIFLAYDISDRIKANPGGWQVVPVASAIGCNGIGANCTASEMAQSDYWNWINEVANKLNGGAGTVQWRGAMCNGNNAANVRVRITWKRANSDTQSRLNNACFSLDVIP